LKAVANSSVLIALSLIEQLALLPRRFPSGILIPPAVWREVVETGQGRPGSEDIAAAAWVKVCQVADTGFVSLLRAELDEGESEALALARQVRVSVVLLDEKDARRTARRLNLLPLGTVGLLVWGKRIGAVGSLKAQLDILQTRGRFRLSPSVYEQALRMVGEG